LSEVAQVTSQQNRTILAFPYDGTELSEKKYLPMYATRFDSEIDMVTYCNRGELKPIIEYPRKGKENGDTPFLNSNQRRLSKLAMLFQAGVNAL
jgi:hypothetical protein